MTVPTPASDSNFEADLSFKDWIGNPITLGSQVTYTSERRSYDGGGLSQVLAEVVGIKARKAYTYENQDAPHFTVSLRTSRESRARKIQRWSGQWTTAEHKVRDVVIHRVENLTAVTVPSTKVEASAVAPLPREDIFKDFYAPDQPSSPALSL